MPSRILQRLALWGTAFAAFAAFSTQAAVLMSVADKAPAVDKASEAHYQKLVDATNAVVGVKVKAIPDAHSNELLGQEREGSGIVIGRDGLVLTIGYLVLEADQVSLTDSDGRTVPATVVACDHATGFGLVRAMGKLAGKPISLGSAASAAPMQRMMIVTGGEEQNISIAAVVSKRPFAGYWEYLIDDAIFTAPARLDHSGAALIDQEGNLVGVGSLFVMEAITPGERLPGNMFVPVDLLRPVLDEMVKTGAQHNGQRPWIGVNSLEEDGRVKVIQVNDESPAARAGIVAGDIILSVDGEPVQSLEDFYHSLWKRGPPGVNVVLTVLHGPTTRNVTVQSIDRSAFARKRPTV